MPDPIPEEVVEAAAIARWDFVCAGIPDDTKWDMRQPHARRFDTDCMRAALTAAAPHIAAQATADLRAGIEVLRDEWRMHEAANLRAASTQPENSSGLLLHTAIAGLCKAHADALDALLRGAK